MNVRERYRDTIPSDPQAAHQVHTRILGLMQDMEFVPKDVAAVRLSLEEALVNAIKHGNKLDKSKSVKIEVEMTRDRITIEIEDEGPGFLPESIPDPTLEENLGKPSGRGVFLIHSFMDTVEYTPPGNRLRMEKQRARTAKSRFTEEEISTPSP